MNFDQTLKLIEILAWPAVALLALIWIKPHLQTLMMGSKIKLTLGGQSIETTLPEITHIIEEQAGTSFNSQEIEFLEVLFHDGAKKYPGGIDKSEDRKFIRPLRNNGLVQTRPRNAFLSEAEAIEVSALGKLLLRSRGKRKSGA